MPIKVPDTIQRSSKETVRLDTTHMVYLSDILTTPPANALAETPSDDTLMFEAVQDTIGMLP